MSLPLLDIHVRQDWQAITWEMARQRRRLWRIAQLAVVAAALVLLLGALFFPAWPGHIVLYSFLFTGILWLLPLWTVYRHAGRSVPATVLRLFAAALLLAAAMVVVYATAPRAGVPNPWLELLPLLIVPSLTWFFLLLMRRRYPVPMRWLGLNFESWPVNLVIGAAAGLALGLHFFIITSRIPELRWGLPTGLPWLLWVVLFRVGLSAVGEEMFFRGMGYYLLTDGTAHGLSATAGQLALLNLVVFLIPLLVVQEVSTAAILLLLAYGAVFALMATFLRHRQGSLIPGLVCNVVFSLFLFFG